MTPHTCTLPASHAAQVLMHYALAHQDAASRGDPNACQQVRRVECWQQLVPAGQAKLWSRAWAYWRTGVLA